MRANSLRLVLVVWHWFAYALAALMIVSGRVRLARKKAFAAGVVSAIYFHKPNRRLALQCLNWLTRMGYKFVSADDVLAMLKHGRALPRGSVWLSFDDGWRDLLTTVLPVIRQRRIPVTLFIPSGIVEGDGRYPWLHDPAHPGYSLRHRLPKNGRREAITVAELREIARYPEVTIGSHTVSHPRTTCCDEKRLRHEIGECKRQLQSWIGKEVKFFAYPEGRSDGRETPLLIEFGYEMAVTTESGLIARGLDPYRLPRFSVGDDVSFPQAICSMVGVWRPVVDRLADACRRALSAPARRHQNAAARKNGRKPREAHSRGALQTTAPSATVREALFDDYDRIAAVHKRNGLKVRPCEDWMAFWKRNPAYRRLEGRWPIGWVLETSEGEVVGSIANLPLEYRLGGKDLIAAASCGWAVDPPYRGSALQLLGSFMSQPDVDFLISTTVNNRSEPAYRAFGWSRAPVGQWNRTEFWVTNYPGFLEVALRTKHVPLPGAMSYPLAPVLMLRDRFRDSSIRNGKPEPRIDLCPAFDGRYEEFWEALQREKPDVLLAVRSRETLAWHFRNAIRRGNLFIVTASARSRMLAYALFERLDNPASGLQRVRLMDFQGLKGSDGALESLLRWMREKCRQEGIHILETMGGWLNGRHFPRVAAPYGRMLPSWAYYYRPSRAREIIEDPAVWAPSSFDGDASL